GRFGTVYLVEDKATGQKFAAKFVNTRRNQDRANVEREVEIMKLLNSEKAHPRLIQLYDAYDMVKEMCLILEIVDGGELFERVIDDDFVLSERACTVFMRQICEGIEFIHSKNILHLDMKPENILCLSREGNRVKICDFGLARRYDPRKKLQVLFGTPEFVAPEVVNFEPISFGTDMWSVGVICYVLLSGLSPFMGHNYVETMTNVTHNKYDFEDEAFDCVTDQAKDFIQKLLVLDKSLRLTPAQCLHHEWLKKPQATRALRRSRMFAISDSESGSGSDSESDECSDSEESSTEDKITREEEERKKREEAARQKEVEAKKKELEKQIEDKMREMEKAKKKEEEEKTKEAEAEARRKAQETHEKKSKEERRNETERRRREDIRKEAEERKRKEEERKRKEEERKREEEALKKKEEELERTKAQLKEFVERWKSHPNSPYLVGTPLPLDVQRLVQSGGWNSRASLSSIAVAPPNDLPDPATLDEDVFLLNDLNDATQQNILINEVNNPDDEEFTMYEITPPQPQQKPSEVARQLEAKLAKLQEENNNKQRESARAVEEETSKKSNKSTRKLSDITNKGKEKTGNREENKKSGEGKATNVRKKSDVDVEINIDAILNKKRVIQIPEKMREENMEKHKRAYEERKRQKSMEKLKDKPEEEQKEGEKEESGKETMKRPVLPIRRTRSRLSQEPVEAEKIINEILQVDHKSAYEEYKKMMADVSPATDVSKENFGVSSHQQEQMINGIHGKEEKVKEDNTNYLKEYEEYLKLVNQKNSKKDEKVNSTDKDTLSKELQQMVSDATKASELSQGGNGMNDVLPLRRPEILALQQEELGGILPRQRKKSLGQQEQSVNEQETGPKGSRGSTSTKQLKKMPSRDVPLQVPRTTTAAAEDESRLIRQNSQDSSGSGLRVSLSRKPSHEDRPPSRESEREGRPRNRRPSRDVPLSPAQLERLASLSGLSNSDLAGPAAQAWPDIIVAPPGEDTEDLNSYDSLDVPVAKLMKSPSGTLLSIPGVTVSKDEWSPPTPPPTLSSPSVSPTPDTPIENNTDDTAFVSNNKLVAWILDIGSSQTNKPQNTCITTERVHQWESLNSSPRLTPSPSRERSPRPSDTSPIPPEFGREKSPKSSRPVAPFKAVSREPSSEHICIQTPWGTIKRSPSNLSKSSSSEVPAITVHETSPARSPRKDNQPQRGDNDAKSVSPRPTPARLQRQAATEIHSPHQSDEIPPKPPEPQKDDWQSGRRFHGDIKYHTLPRNSKLMKQQSVTNFNSHSNGLHRDVKRTSPIDIQRVDEDDLQSLKRKSKFPPSPNHKKKIGPLLFSAQDRISQFEKHTPNSSSLQKPITRTRSSVALNLSSDCPLERSKSGVNISRHNDRTQVGFLKTRLMDKVGKTTATLLEEPDHTIITSRHPIPRFSS
ncbi:hypothetical protein Pcinc_035181, partial [Petrolisthes cinctipes]